MSSLNNMLKMLFKLKLGIVVKKQELAKELNVSEKQIARYKTALDEIFSIESIPGPNGGYRLLDSYFPFKELLTEEEVILLKYYCDSIQGYDNDKLKRALEKINYSILREDNLRTTQIIPYSKVNNNGKDIYEIKNKLYEAILNKNEVIIDYSSNLGKNTRRRIQPYKLFMYKQECYVVAKCLLKQEIRFFKLVRINEIIVTSFKFEIEFDIEKYLTDLMEKSIGIFSGKEYEMKLEIELPMANTVKERIWVDNQIITELGEGKILFEATMKGGPEIISWILSMRSYVKVIKPEILKNELKDELKKMIKKYN